MVEITELNTQTWPQEAQFLENGEVKVTSYLTIHFPHSSTDYYFLVLVRFYMMFGDTVRPMAAS